MTKLRQNEIEEITEKDKQLEKQLSQADLIKVSHIAGRYVADREQLTWSIWKSRLAVLQARRQDVERNMAELTEYCEQKRQRIQKYEDQNPRLQAKIQKNGRMD